MANGNVQAPQVSLAPYGLLSAASRVSHREGDEQWLVGMYWDPEIEPFTVTLVDENGNNESTVVTGIQFTGDETLPTAVGFGILFKDLVKSPFGLNAADRERRLDLVIDITTQTAVEKKLWALFVAEGVTPEASGNASDLGALVARLEQEIMNSTGAAGVLHASRRVASLLAEKQIIAPKGDMLVTNLGTPVVAGFGYGSTAIYGTGPLDVHLGPVITYDVFGQPTNEIVVQAERSAGVVWDSNVLVSVGVTL